MLNLLPLLGTTLLVAPLQTHLPVLPLQAHSPVYSSIASPFLPPSSVALTPHPTPTTNLLADATGAYISDAFDAAFLVVVPLLLGGMLFLFFKLLKKFADAF